MIRIVLTKGRIEEKAEKLLEKSGYDMSCLRDKGRKLILPVPNAPVEILLAKAMDVITYVEHGVCDMGIVGKDTIMEYGRSFYEVLDLKFGKCRFALAGRLQDKEHTGMRQRVIATKYPRVTREYFNSIGENVEIVKIDGSVEIAPLIGLADAIVDLVETGETLRANGLDEFDDICNITARLIVNTASIKLKKDEADDFIRRLAENIKGD